MKRPKLYSFFFHYHKALSQKRGKNVLSIHFQDACHFVEGLQCKVPVSTRNRKRQPHCVMAGRATGIAIRDVAGSPHAIIS
jgi:hypothetical protein